MWLFHVLPYQKARGVSGGKPVSSHYRKVTCLAEVLVVGSRPVSSHYRKVTCVGVTCLCLTVDRLPTSIISVTTTENCLSFAN